MVAPYERKKPMFIQIKKTNKRNEEGIALIRTEDIVAICQQPKHVTKLFDESGNVVSETEDAPRYAVLTSTNQTYMVDETQYNELKDTLTK